ncbi:MAG: hypothetical protein AAF628_16955 [Planctomycetota bacterium]
MLSPRLEEPAPAQDFGAALHEVESNLEVRRLMFVLSNVLVPACLLALSDGLTGTAYPPALRWLPEHLLPLVGGILMIAGVLVTGILTRCHFGLVVNGSKMAKVTTGVLRAQPLYWLGVTANFVALTALSAAGGASLLVAGLGAPLAAAITGPVLFLLCLIYLRWNHGRANRLCARLTEQWQAGTVAAALREEHARKSLDATTADISVIVVMAAALFAGAFNSMTNVGGLTDALTLTPAAATLRAHGVAALSGFALVSLLLSARMVVRLRIALAEHSQTLAALRGEADQPWRFRLHERTYLLFGIVHLLSVAAAVILAWDLGGVRVGLGVGGGLLIAGLVWYPWALWRAGRRQRA